MIEAFVLIQAEVGMASRVGQTVSGMQGVPLCRCRDRAIRCGRPRRGCEHRCARNPSRLEDPGGRGHRPDTDLSHGAALTGA